MENPLVITDDELGKLYKEVAAADWHGQLEVRFEARKPRHGETGKGKHTPIYVVQRKPTRAVGYQREVAWFFSRTQAETFVLLANIAQHLIDTLQAERAGARRA